MGAFITRRRRVRSEEEGRVTDVERPARAWRCGRALGRSAGHATLDVDDERGGERDAELLHRSAEVRARLGSCRHDAWLVAQDVAAGGPLHLRPRRSTFPVYRVAAAAGGAGLAAVPAAIPLAGQRRLRRRSQEHEQDWDHAAHGCFRITGSPGDATRIRRRRGHRARPGRTTRGGRSCRSFAGELERARVDDVELRTVRRVLSPELAVRSRALRRGLQMNARPVISCARSCARRQSRRGGPRRSCATSRARARAEPDRTCRGDTIGAPRASFPLTGLSDVSSHGIAGARRGRHEVEHTAPSSRARSTESGSSSGRRCPGHQPPLRARRDHFIRSARGAHRRRRGRR